MILLQISLIASLRDERVSLTPVNWCMTEQKIHFEMVCDYNVSIILIFVVLELIFVVLIH